MDLGRLIEYLRYYHEGVDIELWIECYPQGWFFWNGSKGCHEKFSLKEMLALDMRLPDMRELVRGCHKYYISTYEMFYHLME